MASKEVEVTKKSDDEETKDWSTKDGKYPVMGDENIMQRYKRPV